ncbi:MAG: RNA-binding protein [Patescibacteria group bacterium]
MAKKLYVGGLSYGTTDESLKTYFSQAGAVETATIVIDRASGRSRGFGFVEMTSDDEATKAVEMFNGKEFEGRTIVVTEARPLADRPPRSGGFNRGGGRGGFGGGNRGGFGGGNSGGSRW